MFRFALRDLFWLMLLTALLITWWREGLQLDSEKRVLENEIRNSTSARDAAIKRLRMSDPYFVAEGWHTIAEPDDFELGLDSQVRHGGAYSAFIKSKTSTDELHAVLYQTVRADAYRGKRVRLAGHLKTENAIRRSSFLSSFFIGSTHRREDSFNTYCDQRIPSSADWQRYDLVLDIPTDAALITFGVIAPAGTLWVDDLRLEVVASDVPSTTPSFQYGYHFEPAQGSRRLTFPRAPLSLDFELPVPTRRHDSD